MGACGFLKGVEINNSTGPDSALFIRIRFLSHCHVYTIAYFGSHSNIGEAVSS
jgi:hypothetical protein